MRENAEIQIVQSISERCSQDKAFWDFKDVIGKAGIHNVMRYPATMVPEMQQELIKILCEATGAKSIMDPFMGSGTVLVEGLKNGMDVYGLDINPLSYLLCKSKLTYISTRRMETEFGKLTAEIETGNIAAPIHSFDNSEKWFRPDVIRALSVLRHKILQIARRSVREFFLVTLADVVTQVKNSQSSTFKLHIKPQQDIESFQLDVYEAFFQKLRRNIDIYIRYQSDLKAMGLVEKQKIKRIVNLRCGDTKDLISLLGIEEESIDLVVTSPPYGDNHTTVTYGQFSILPLKWISGGVDKSSINDDLLKNFNAIDTASLGGKLYTQAFIQQSGIMNRSEVLACFYGQLMGLGEDRKARKVAAFMIDFEQSLLQINRAIKPGGYFVMVVGNRKVHNLTMSFDKMITELAAERFTQVTEFNRSISRKRMPTKISKVNDTAVHSMSAENIMILKKK